jgi:hypothetical protein
VLPVKAAKVAQILYAKAKAVKENRAVNVIQAQNATNDTYSTFR